MSLPVRLLIAITLVTLAIMVVGFSNLYSAREGINDQLVGSMNELAEPIEEVNSFLDTKGWEQNLNKEKAFSNAIFNGVVAENATFKLKDSSKSLLPQPKRDNDCHVSAYQGIEVRFESLMWRNSVFTGNNHNDTISDFFGKNTIRCNNLNFDPDLPNKGFPNLVAELSEPKLFDLNNFLKTPLKSYQLSKGLNMVLSSSKPVETDVWSTQINGEPTKIRMEVWLMEFDLSISARPSQSNDIPQGFDKTKKNPITGQTVNEMRDEHDNYRYDAIDLILEFVPKSQNWYIENDASNDSVFNPGELNIGIGAVEVIYLDVPPNKLREGGSQAGVYLAKGKSLALSNSLQDIPGRSSLNGLRDKAQLLSELPSDFLTAKREVVKTDTGNLNTELFGQTKYAVIQFPNIGTWHEKGGLFSKEKTFADQVNAKLLLHTFVVGKWSLKRPDTGPLVPPPPISFEKPSILGGAIQSFSEGVAKLLPEFSMGWLVTLFWPFIFVVLAIVLFPSLVGLVVSSIFRTLKNLIPR